MSTPFIFAVQSAAPKAFNRDEMKKRERVFAARFGMASMMDDTCTLTGDDTCDDNPDEASY